MNLKLNPVLNRAQHRLAPLALCGAGLIVAACGGGGGGISGTGTVPDVSYGSVAALGSVWVNGVEFDTATATVLIDDTVAADDRGVKVGMVVQVDGSIKDKHAETVTVEASLKGFVEAVVDANRIVVMGQTVQIDERTQFAGTRPARGDRVEVHGLVVAGGVIAGGYIERKATAPTPPFALKGLVTEHSVANKTFKIGTLAVHYDSARVDDLGSTSWNGLLVQVKGTACAANPVCTTLTASSVKAGGVRAEDGAKAEVEGYVTALRTGGFVVGTQVVSTDSSTVFEGGVLGDVLAGTQLEAEGTVRAGVLRATKVVFKENIRIEADVASVSTASLTLSGLTGVRVNADALTEFGGGANQITDLAAGEHVRLRGRLTPNHTVVATRLERRSAKNEVTLQAPVEALNSPRLTLLGVVVDTSTIADGEFKSVPGGATRAAFFSAVKLKALVKARGALSTPSSIVWDQVELED